MKRLSSTMVILLLSSGLAFAQSNPGGMRSTVPNTATSTIPQPPNDATVGYGAGMNPSNPQAATASVAHMANASHDCRV